MAEGWADDAAVRGMVREAMNRVPRATGPPRLGRQAAAQAKQQLERAEQVRDVLRLSRAAGQNAFAPFSGDGRGEAEEVLRVGLEIDEEPLLRRSTGRLVTNPSFLFPRELTETVADCYRRLLFPSLESTLLAEMKEKADEEAILSSRKTSASCCSFRPPDNALC